MRMTGGEALVQSLEANGVDVAFGIAGAHNLAVYDALLDSSIRHIAARHEQGAAFMADGYARASGRVGVCISTSGPAALNVATPLGTAYCDSTPVLCIASQIPSHAIGLEKGFIHECRDQLGCLSPVSGWCQRAESAAAIPGVVREAFSRLRTARTRPSVLEVACDVLDGDDDVELLPAVGRIRRPAAEHQIERAARILAVAERPVIWAGGGVITSEASDELRRLAELLQAPVSVTVMGKGAFPEDHPLSAGSSLVHPDGSALFRNSDVMLAVGTRFTQDDTNNWTLPFPEQLIHIDLDEAEHGRNCQPSLAIVGDARESLKQLADSIAAQGSLASTDRTEAVAALRRHIRDDCVSLAPMGVELVDILRSSLPRDTVVVSDLTQAAYWSRRLLDFYEPRTNIYPWGFCTLGFGVPAAIGAKLGAPDRPVVCLTGDGGFLFNFQELAVAVEFDVSVVVLLFNNNAYGALKPQQQARYGRTLATDLANPDFVAISRAFGLRSERIETLEALGPALETALASDESWVLEITADVPQPIMEPGPRSQLTQ